MAARPQARSGTHSRLLSAPGKLFLAGEYAVLWGAPAVLVAVGPRLTVSVRRVGTTTLQLEVPGHRITLPLVDGRAGGWPEAHPGARFVQGAASRRLEVRPTPVGLHLRFSPSPRGEHGEKLGLGTSAAAAVLAAAAVAPDALATQRHELFAAAAAAHWSVQGGKGSNGDVAASCFGGLLRYERWPVEQAEPGPVQVKSLPAELLHFGFVESGSAAETPSMVKAVEARLSPEGRAHFVAASTAATGALVSALERGDGAGALEGLLRGGEVLAELGRAVEVPIVTEALARILAMPRPAEVGLRLSGAGGGDGLVAASTDPEALDHWLAGRTDAGLRTRRLKVEEGVREEPRRVAPRPRRAPP